MNLTIHTTWPRRTSGQIWPHLGKPLWVPLPELQGPRPLPAKSFPAKSSCPTLCHCHPCLQPPKWALGSRVCLCHPLNLISACPDPGSHLVLPQLPVPVALLGGLPWGSWNLPYPSYVESWWVRECPSGLGTPQLPTGALRPLGKRWACNQPSGAPCWTRLKSHPGLASSPVLSCFPLPPSIAGFPWEHIFNKSLAHKPSSQSLCWNHDLLTFEQSWASGKTAFSILHGQGRGNLWRSNKISFSTMVTLLAPNLWEIIFHKERTGNN